MYAKISNKQTVSIVDRKLPYAKVFENKAKCIYRAARHITERKQYRDFLNAGCLHIQIRNGPHGPLLYMGFDILLPSDKLRACFLISTHRRASLSPSSKISSVAQQCATAATGCRLRGHGLRGHGIAVINGAVSIPSGTAMTLRLQLPRH